jgi:MFS transporter, DHA1 family, multidrug resistance protein
MRVNGPILGSSWRRTLWIMVAVQFVMSLGVTVFVPILPLFLPELGVTSLPAIDLWSGMITAVTPLIAAFASPLWGALGDRYGRRSMVLRSSAAVCVFTVLMALTTNPWQLFGIRAVLGVFAGFSATAIALVATEIPEQRLGYGLGWLSTGQLVGSLLGPLAGGLVADLAHDYRAVFYWTAALSAVCLFMTWRFIPDTHIPAKGRPRSSVRDGLRLVMGSSSLLSLVFVLLLSQVAIRTIQPLVTLFVEELLGPVPALATLAGLAFSITGVSDLLASPFLGKRSDVIGYRRVLVISLCGAAVASLPQAFVSNYWAFIAERFGLGMFLGGILPTANALLGRLVEPGRRGFIYGVTSAAFFLGNFAGPLLGGSLAAVIGIRPLFFIAAGVFLLTCLWVVVAVPEIRGSDSGGGAAGRAGG